jgi:hypothetical protein
MQEAGEMWTRQTGTSEKLATWVAVIEWIAHILKPSMNYFTTFFPLFILLLFNETIKNTSYMVVL